MIEIMQSMRPKWCELEVQGKKTIEVRKTRPKCETPFKVDIYCTKPTFPHEDYIIKKNGPCIEKAFYAGGKVIGEYICDEIYTYNYLDEEGEYDILYKFPDHYEKLCLNPDELLTYGDGKTLYGWHISDLKIYDTPKELGEFFHPCPNPEAFCKSCKYVGSNPFDGEIECRAFVRRPPQSWCYVHRID